MICLRINLVTAGVNSISRSVSLFLSVSHKRNTASVPRLGGTPVTTTTDTPQRGRVTGNGRSRQYGPLDLHIKRWLSSDRDDHCLIYRRSRRLSRGFDVDATPEADSSMMIDTVLYSMSQMECYPTVRQRGVVTIPEEVRDGLHLEEGDQLKLTAETLE